MFNWLRARLRSHSSETQSPATAAARLDADAETARDSTDASRADADSAAPPGPLSLLRRGRLDDAASAAARALDIDVGDASAHLVRVLVALERGRALEAVRLAEQSLALRPDDLDLAVTKARALAACGKRAEAARGLQELRAAHPDRAEPLAGLAALAIAGRKESKASELLTAAIRLDPQHVDSQFQLGQLARRQGRIDEAIERWRATIASEPDRVDALNNLGGALRDRGRLDEAAIQLERARALQPGLASAAFNLGLLRADQRRWVEAREHLRAYAALEPRDADGQYWLGNASMAIGHDTDARQAYQAALRANGQHVQARWGFTMAQLPAVPASDAEQAGAPEAFRREVAKLRTWFRGNPKAEGHRAVGAQQPFYLAYVPQNVRPALADYGALATQLMGAWARKVGVPKPRAASGPRVRVGVVSAHVCSHSVWHAVLKGWVEHLDPVRFELELFHTGTAHDAETEWAARRVAQLHHRLGDWPAWAKTISDRRFDILIYPEIGMDSTTTRLATLRLAPAQLASWGHPVTTGLPTIDAYLSAEDFEPAGAGEQYTERLVRLPRLGCCYRPFGLAPERADLARLGVASGDRVLLCAGTPFKYAPRDDRVLVEIARRCQPCKIVFFRADPEPLSTLLEKRLRRVFEAESLAFDECVRFVRWQSHRAFFGLLDLADVFLDSIGFSGFNTAMQAVERRAPIVAFEGEFMRGRFASAILRRAGLDEWVASDSDGYVDRVAKLCGDGDARSGIKKRLSAASPVLFDDRASVLALADELCMIAGKG